MIATLVVVGLLGVLGLVIHAGQRALFYYPDSRVPGLAAAASAGAEEIELSTEDGLTLSAWLMRPAGSGDVAVLYLPGNGGNRADRAGAGQALTRQGFTVLLLDYRGYGGNPGRPSEEGTASDARAGATWLRENGFSPELTIYFGESLGTGVATRLAVTDPPAGLLLRSPFTSLTDVAVGQVGGLPVGWLVRDRYDTLALIGQVTCPVRVLAGGADPLIPAAQSLAVAQAAPDLQGYVELPGVGHNDEIWFGPYLAEQTQNLSQAAVDRP